MNGTRSWNIGWACMADFLPPPPLSTLLISLKRNGARPIYARVMLSQPPHLSLNLLSWRSRWLYSLVRKITRKRSEIFSWSAPCKKDLLARNVSDSRYYRGGEFLVRIEISIFMICDCRERNCEYFSSMYCTNFPSLLVFQLFPKTCDFLI